MNPLVGHDVDNCQCPICRATADNMKWQKDTSRDDAERIIANLNSRDAGGSYVIGAPQSGEDGEVGIYFVNPAEVLKNIEI